MLVLTRKVEEEISIGEGLITIKVVHITPTRVRLGIDCPSDISVNRGEVESRKEVDDDRP